MTKYLKIIRFPNLMIVALSMILTLRFVIQPIIGLPVIDHGFGIWGMFFLVMAVLLIMAGGNVINDIFDVNKDSINKPGKNLVGNNISEKAAYRLYWITTILGVLSGFVVSYITGQLNFTLIFPVVAGLLYFYSQKYCCVPLLGNVIVAILSSLSFGIVWFFYFYSLTNEPVVFLNVRPMFIVVNTYVFFYMIYAFTTTLLREVIKDIEDYKGDNRFGCRTLPVAYGISIARIVALFFLSLCLAGTILIQFYWLTYSYYILVGAFVIIDAIFALIIIKLIKAEMTSDYHKISILIKILMIAGILSMLLINFEF